MNFESLVFFMLWFKKASGGLIDLGLSLLVGRKIIGRGSYPSLNYEYNKDTITLKKIEIFLENPDFFTFIFLLVTL